MAEFKLTQQHAPPEQERMFSDLDIGRAVTKANGELLQAMLPHYGVATVDDLEEWRDGLMAAGACIRCLNHFEAVSELPRARCRCPKCKTWTVCNTSDIAAGRTPGAVSEGDK